MVENESGALLPGAEVGDFAGDETGLIR